MRFYILLLIGILGLYLLRNVKESFTEKKKVVFLFSGNARTFPFSKDTHKRSHEILESYNRYVFTESFKEKYNYEIYITSDHLDLEDTLRYFSENHIKNIHLLDDDSYLTNHKDRDTNIKNIQHYLNKYNEKDWSHYLKHEGSIHQHYKILDCYQMAKNDNNIHNSHYIVRMRMDIEMTRDLQEIIGMIDETPELEIVIDGDLFALGTPSIMEWYCTGLENNYGNYNYNIPVPDTLPIMNDYGRDDKKRWTYAAERQLFEMLYDYCVQRNLDINQTIRSAPICVIKR